MTTLTVITPTLDCETALPRLVSSLQSQTDPDFQWVVADAQSSDSTLEIVQRSALKNMVVDSRADFSIYDGINRGIRAASGEYYLVLGADDLIDPDTVANYKKSTMLGEVDIVVASVRAFGRVVTPMTGKRWWRGCSSIISSHSVGTLIRRRLHERLGYYSNRFVNAADMQFILKAADDSSVKIGLGKFVAGEFGSGGISSTDQIASLTDAFRVQLAVEPSAALQFAIYVCRLGKAIFLRGQR